MAKDAGHPIDEEEIRIAMRPLNELQVAMFRHAAKAVFSRLNAESVRMYQMVIEAGNDLREAGEMGKALDEECNALVDDYNALLAGHNALVDDYNGLLDEYNTLLDKRSMTPRKKGTGSRAAATTLPAGTLNGFLPG
jgi:hypothetical protein